MSDLYWLTEEQMAWFQPSYFKSHGKPRVDDRRVLSGIVFVNRNGLHWCDAPTDYGPHKTLYNWWQRWGEKGIFLEMMKGLAAASADPKTGMIDATPAFAGAGSTPRHTARHRACGSKGGLGRPDRPHQRRDEHEGSPELVERLHAVSDVNGRPLSFFMTAG